MDTEQAAASRAEEERRTSSIAARKAEAALAERSSAGRLRRLLMKSQARLERQRATEVERETVSAARLVAAATALARVRTLLDAVEKRRATLGAEVAPYDRSQIVAEQRSLEAARAPRRAELAKIESQLADIERAVLENARVIGTTVTRAYLSAEDLGPFDVVIVDEASMVLLPALYVAAGLAREQVTISGDFNQLPPIVQTRQQAVFDEIGRDVFTASGVANERRSDRETDRLLKLDVQRRMVEPICAIVDEAMEYGGLHTHPCVLSRAHAPKPPSPFDGPLTVIDTSCLWPFECRNTFGSRFNLMHALLVRNLSVHLDKSGFLVDEKRLGICTPYAAQAKLTRAILADAGVGQRVVASTVHRYQGDQRRMMLLDIPESIGSGFNLGRFIQADSVDDDGAKLLNVAVSRAQDHLVILANLTYLDPRLPSLAKLRFYIHEMQRRGAVVDAQAVLSLQPITDDLRRYGEDSKIEWDIDQAGRFRSEGFDRVFRLDVEQAKKSVAIFSGYITEQRAASYGDLFRRKIAEGVAIRCVTRPPRFNGSMTPAATKTALDALEAIGVVVDTRASIHQKVAVVDDKIVWLGSLNALSHTANTDEVMVRATSPQFALDLAPLLAIGSIRVAEGTSPWTAKENPTCAECGGRMYYARGRHGAFFKCEECGRSRSQFAASRKGNSKRRR